MNVQTIHIRFARLGSYRSLTEHFQSVLMEDGVKSILLILDFSDKNLFVHSDYLLAIVALVSHLQEKGIDVSIVVEGECDYASRVNFLKHLGIPYKEGFTRRGSVGRFIELSRFTNDTTYSL